MMPMLAVENLAVEFASARGTVRALDGADLVVAAGEIFGIVGESGSGKSTLGMAVGRVLAPNARCVSGDVRIAGHSVLALDRRGLRRLRADELGFVFQDPIGTLDPTRRIGQQVKAALGGAAARAEIAAMLREVGLGDDARIGRSYPHEMSGGMAQRISIGIALARRPRIVIADEPTASLDASIKSQILDLLVARCRAVGAVLILLSHDLHAIRKCADRVAVMYGGRLVETGPTAAVLARPAHPYTAALLRAAIGREPQGGRVEPISGAPPVLAGRPEGCAFAPRCGWRLSTCAAIRPEAHRLADRDVICHRADAVYAGTALA
jgi:oligopeptide/dipeptide ABC transporter ATP-binding protein